jgi:hypothetical protein
MLVIAFPDIIEFLDIVGERESIKAVRGGVTLVVSET